MTEQERELDLIVAELEQENRLLRARNERLEREAIAAHVQEPVGVEGAIVNGRVYADRLERDYQFECEAGPLNLCNDWVEFRRCFEWLAEHTTPPAAPVQEPVGRTDQQIVDQTQELAVWLLAWCFNHKPETNMPMRQSTHPFAERCWAAACHIQEMLTATDPENAVAELDAAPVQEPWSDERAFHEGRGDYEIGMHRLHPKGTWPNFHDLTPIQQAGWVLKAAQRFYTTPPAAQPAVPLTDEQILHFVGTHVGSPNPSYPLDNSDWLHFARAIEAAHGIKGAA